MRGGGASGGILAVAEFRGIIRVMNDDIPSAICRDEEAPVTEFSSFRFLELLLKAFDMARFKRLFASE